jgi:hypothetical protein
MAFVAAQVGTNLRVLVLEGGSWEGETVTLRSVERTRSSITSNPCPSVTSNTVCRCITRLHLDARLLV